MLSGWHLSRSDCSSAAILQPLLHLVEVESDIFPELEMVDGIRCILPGSVVDKRDRDFEQVSELWGSEKVIQRGTPCLGGMETRDWAGATGGIRAQTVLRGWKQIAESMAWVSPLGLQPKVLCLLN
jgi:hypothetical protein